MGQALPRFGQRSDRGSPGAGVLGFPGRCEESRSRVYRNAGPVRTTQEVVSPQSRRAIRYFNAVLERSMFKTIAIVIVVLIVAVLIYAATKPDTFRVERSLSIKAPPEKIFPLVNDLHNHAVWSPWEKKDPAMERTHSGAPSGKGAVYEWDGNKEIGKGRMEITESSPPHKVVFAMHFIEPFEAHNIAESRWNPRETPRP